MLTRKPQSDATPSGPTPAEIELAYEAAQAVVTTHRRLAEWLKVGMTLGQIDRFVAEQLEDLKSRSCFLGYKVPRLPPFPSHACLSLNECVVHGTAGYYTKPMQPGDVLKIDIGVFRRGWVGDAGWTYGFREVSPEVRRLMESGKESLRRGVQELGPGKPLINWAKTVQGCVEEEYGFHLVRGLGGHGYGKRLHDKPFVSNVVPADRAEWPEAFEHLRPGTMMAVEPMIGLGTGATRSDPRKWPVFIADGSVSVHYEHDVLVTPTGPRVLTEGLEQLPDIVG